MDQFTTPLLSKLDAEKFSGPFLRARVASLMANGATFQGNFLSGEILVETYEDSYGSTKAMFCHDGLDWRCTITTGGTLVIEAAE